MLLPVGMFFSSLYYLMLLSYYGTLDIIKLERRQFFTCNGRLNLVIFVTVILLSTCSKRDEYIYQ